MRLYYFWELIGLLLYSDFSAGWAAANTAHVQHLKAFDIRGKS